MTTSHTSLNSRLDRPKALRGWHLPSYARILFVWFVGADIARGLPVPEDSVNLSEREEMMRSSQVILLHFTWAHVTG